VGGTLHPDGIMAIVNEIHSFADTNIATVDDYERANNREDLIETTKTLISGKIETLRKSGTEEQFAEFERRLSLAAIDELWMQHIDRMAHLREEVAFE
jgi:preprotein translocase subunit SecA